MLLAFMHEQSRTIINSRFMLLWQQQPIGHHADRLHPRIMASQDLPLHKSMGLPLGGTSGRNFPDFLNFGRPYM